MVIESNFLSDRQVEDLQMVAEIVNAMAVSDGFPNLDACLEKHPKRLNFYNRYATVALQAMRRVQGHTTPTGGDELAMEIETENTTKAITTIIKGGLTDK